MILLFPLFDCKETFNWQCIGDRRASGSQMCIWGRERERKGQNKFVFRYYYEFFPHSSTIQWICHIERLNQRFFAQRWWYTTFSSTAVAYAARERETRAVEVTRERTFSHLSCDFVRVVTLRTRDMSLENFNARKNSSSAVADLIPCGRDVVEVESDSQLENYENKIYNFFLFFSLVITQLPSTFLPFSQFCNDDKNREQLVATSSILPLHLYMIHFNFCK